MAGFNECTNEVTSYLDSIDGMTSEARSQVARHLSNHLHRCSRRAGGDSRCDSEMTQLAPVGVTQSIALQQTTATNLNNVCLVNPSLQPHFQPQQQPQTQQPALPVQLIPAKLPSGQTVYVLANQQLQQQVPTLLSPGSAVATLNTNTQQDLQQQNFTVLNPLLPNVLKIEPPSPSNILLSPTPSNATVPLYITNTSCSSTSSNQFMLTSPVDVTSRSASRTSSSDGSTPDSFSSLETQSTSGLTSSTTSLQRQSSVSPASFVSAPSPPRTAASSKTTHSSSRKRKHAQQVRADVMNADSTATERHEKQRIISQPPVTMTSQATADEAEASTHTTGVSRPLPEKTPSREQTWRPW